MVNDVVLQETSVVGDLDACRQTGYFLVVRSLFKWHSTFCFAVVDGLGEEEEDGRAEILSLQ